MEAGVQRPIGEEARHEVVLDAVISAEISRDQDAPVGHQVDVLHQEIRAATAGVEGAVHGAVAVQAHEVVLAAARIIVEPATDEDLAIGLYDHLVHQRGGRHRLEGVINDGHLGVQRGGGAERSDEEKWLHIGGGQ